MKSIKTNFIKILFLLLVPATFALSCKKNLYLNPTDIIPEEKAFETVDDLEKGAIATYAFFSIRPDAWTSAVVSDEVRWGLDNTSRNYGRSACFWEYTSASPDADDVVSAWVNLYPAIDRVNRVLAGLEKVKAVNDAEEKTKVRIKAEMLALRALCLFNIHRWFAQDYNDANALSVVAVKEVLPTNAKPQRNTTGEVVAQIRNDITEALATMPPGFDGSGRTRLTLPAIYALQSRFELYNKDWAKVIDASSKAITSVPLTVDTAVYKKIWKDEELGEVIFKKKLAANGGLVTTFTDSNGDVFFSPSTKLKSLFDADKDIRHELFFSMQGAKKEPSIVNKYPGQTDAKKFNDEKVFRTSEMYLNRAEAYANNNQIDLANNDLKAVRAARISGYSHINISSKETLIKEILTEKYKELAFEGQRFFDLRRLKLPVERASADIDPVVTGMPSIPQKLEPTNFRYVFPIYSNEVKASKMQQNPGY